MTVLMTYKPLPELSELDPGIEPFGFQTLILQAEPIEKIGSIIITDQTKDDVKVATVEAVIVDIADQAFTGPDWPEGVRKPEIGDHIFTKRYPAGARVKGNDGREYMLVDRDEIKGIRKRADKAKAKAA